jgi:hypothetical protein
MFDFGIVFSLDPSKCHLPVRLSATSLISRAQLGVGLGVRRSRRARRNVRLRNVFPSHGTVNRGFTQFDGTRNPSGH